MSRPITKEKLGELASYILSGMSEKESCLLIDISYPQLQALKEKNEDVRNYIEKLFIKFKYNNLKEIQKNKSEKNSQWLLEKLRPEEFGAKARNNEQPTINIISQIIKQIQNDNDPIVTFSRGNRLGSGDQSDQSNTDTKLRVAEILG